MTEQRSLTWERELAAHRAEVSKEELSQQGSGAPGGVVCWRCEGTLEKLDESFDDVVARVREQVKDATLTGWICKRMSCRALVAIVAKT